MKVYDRLAEAFVAEGATASSASWAPATPGGCTACINEA